MNNQFDISVIICTYNRCDLLPIGLESVLSQENGDVNYEVIVVDNNSSDQTRQVVESFIARGHENLRYIFEGKQGLSHARNAGITSARAPVVAFTDDDVSVARNWISLIKRAFDEHPAIAFAGGKVLPRWEQEPPSWLTRTHWSPLATTDYGDEPFYLNLDKPFCMVGANLIVRREVFDQVGLFAPDLQRVKDSIGSMEDHEFLLRIWNTGGQGLYVPEIVVTADVQRERMTKDYHRRWHTGHGYYYGILQEKERAGDTSAHLFDVPAHMYRQSLIDAVGWLRQSLRRNEELAFFHEVELRFFRGYFRQRRARFRALSQRGTIREVMTFLRDLTASKAQRNAHT